MVKLAYSKPALNDLKNIYDYIAAEGKHLQEILFLKDGSK